VIIFLEDALSDALVVYDDNDADQDEIDAAATALTIAIENVRLKPDKSALESLVAKANKLSKDTYTVESWAKLEAGLNGANEVLDSNTVLQDDVDTAYTTLKSALNGLVIKSTDGGTMNNGNNSGNSGNSNVSKGNNDIKKVTASPETSDNSKIMICVLLMILSMGVFGVLHFRKRAIK